MEGCIGIQMTANTSSQTESKAKTERRSELDLMGMLVVLGLVFFHTAQIFAGGDFYVMSEPPSTMALMLIAFASLWGMPFMFIITGILGLVGMALILAGLAFHLIDSTTGLYAGLVVWLVGGVFGGYAQRVRE
jgi:hypothetical protein